VNREVRKKELGKVGLIDEPVDVFFKKLGFVGFVLSQNTRDQSYALEVNKLAS